MRTTAICTFDAASKRTCERGNFGCEVRHTEPDAGATVEAAGYVRQIRKYSSTPGGSRIAEVDTHVDLTDVGTSLPHNTPLYTTPPTSATVEAAISKARAALYAIANTLHDYELRRAAREAYDALASQPAPGDSDPRNIVADTGHPEADRLIGRLTSADPDFNDCTDAAVLIRKLVVEHKGPDGYATWKDAAIAERMRRVAAPGEAVAWYDPNDFTRTTDRPTEKEYAPLYPRPTDAAAVEREAYERAAKWLEKQAEDYFNEQGGYEDLNTISFGRGRNADFKLDWYNRLQELAEELRALRNPAPEQKEGE